MDMPAGSPTAQVSKLSRVPAAPTTASEQLQIRRSAHRKKVEKSLLLLPSARRQLIQWAHKTNGEDPQVVTDCFDVFAQKEDRAMSQPWTGKCFSLHPRPEELKDTVQEILLDGAKGILVPPTWKNMPHFWSVGEVAIDWWDCPPEMPIYQGLSHDGRPVSSCLMRWLPWTWMQGWTDRRESRRMSSQVIERAWTPPPPAT